MSQAVMVPPIEELRQVQRMVYTVHNAGDELFEQQLSGMFYRIEPHGDLEIADRLDYPRDKKTGKFLHTIPDRFGNRTGMPDPEQEKVVPEGGDAYTILKNLFSEGCECEKRGLCIVRGDGRDVERQQAAWQNYVTWRCERADRKQTQWLRQVEMATSGGGLPPVMPAHIRDDIAFLAKYKYGTVVIQRKAFISFDGGCEADTRAEVVAYLKQLHPRLWAEKGESLIRVRDEAVPQPVGWTPPAKLEPLRPVDEIETLPKPEIVAEAPAGPETEDLGWMLDEAANLDVTLTPAEVKALRAGTDQEAIMAIGARLISAKEKQPKKGGA